MALEKFSLGLWTRWVSEDPVRQTFAAIAAILPKEERSMYSHDKVEKMIAGLAANKIVILTDDHQSKVPFDTAKELMKRTKYRGVLMLEVSYKAHENADGLMAGIKAFEKGAKEGTKNSGTAEMAQKCGWGVQCIDCTKANGDTGTITGWSTMGSERQKFIGKFVNRAVEIYDRGILIIGKAHVQGKKSRFVTVPALSKVAPNLASRGEKLMDSEGKLYARIVAKADV